MDWNNSNQTLYKPRFIRYFTKDLKFIFNYNSETNMEKEVDRIVILGNLKTFVVSNHKNYFEVY